MIINFWIYRISKRIKAYFRNEYIKHINSISYITPPKILGDITVNATNVKFGKNVTIYSGVYLWGSNIEIGDNVNIGIGTIIYSRNGVTIGDNTIIAGQCYIIDSNHRIQKDVLIQKQDLDSIPNEISIGKDVWIGAQCSILKGAKINDGAVIGAQSLVNKEIPVNAIAFGTPAEVISYRK